MKIVIINSSPRRNGNTAQMCDAFRKGVKELREAFQLGAKVAMQNNHTYYLS